MIKRLIFDVDGTLITGVNFINSIKKTLEKIDLNSEENVEGFLNGIKKYESCYDNYNSKDYIKHMENSMNVVLPKDFLKMFFDELKFCIPKDNKMIFANIKKLSKKYEMVILTNYFSESQLNRLDTMGIKQFFSECYGERKIKPYKESYLSACGNHKPEECVMIGDDINLDIYGAQKEGLHTIFVNTKKIDVGSKIGVSVNSVEEISIELIESLI